MQQKSLKTNDNGKTQNIHKLHLNLKNTQSKES